MKSVFKYSVYSCKKVVYPFLQTKDTRKQSHSVYQPVCI